MFGGIHTLPTDGICYVTHIEVPVRIHRYPVWGDELRWPFAFLWLANTGL